MPDEELDDSSEGLDELSRGSDRRAVLRESLRVAVVGVAAMVVVLRAEQVTVTTTHIAAAGVVLGVLAHLRASWAGARRQGQATEPTRLLTASLVLAGAVVVIVFPTSSLEAIGRIVGATALVVGIVLLVRGRARPSQDHAQEQDHPREQDHDYGHDDRHWGSAGASVIGGGLLLAFPGLLVVAALWAAVVLYLLVGAIRIGMAVRAEPVEGRGSLEVLRGWFERLERGETNRRGLYAQLYFEGDAAGSRSARFAVLMGLAGVISAVGVATDSTAVVVGAMLIAPLITPMMAASLALVMGWPNRMGRSAALVVVGVLIPVAIGWVTPKFLATALDVTANAQIVSRSSPTLTDLAVAVAAGIAGAYALSRPDVGSSLPGVAVAIALVPPLSVVGITLEAGDYGQAAGTFLLFLTNGVAILTAGGLTFVLTGIAPIRQVAANQRRVATASAGVLALGVLVVAGLSLNGAQLAQDELDGKRARRSVAEWLGDNSAFAAPSVDVDADRVVVVLAGPGRPPSSEDLANDLAADLGHPVTLDLQWIPRQREVVSGGADPPG